MSAKLKFCGLNDESAFSLQDQIEAHKKLDWNALELRAINGNCINEMKDNDLDEVINLIHENNIKVPVVSSDIGSKCDALLDTVSDDLAKLKKLIKVALALNTNYIRIMSYPNPGLSQGTWKKTVLSRIVRLAEMAANANLELLLENCHGWAALDADRALELMQITDGQGVGLLFDTGNPACFGYDGVSFLKATICFTKHVHIKDALTSKESGKYKYTMPGHGDAKLNECLKLLIQNRYDGYFSIEPHLAYYPGISVLPTQSYLQKTYLNYANEFIKLASKFEGSHDVE